MKLTIAQIITISFAFALYISCSGNPTKSSSATVTPESDNTTTTSATTSSSTTSNSTYASSVSSNGSSISEKDPYEVMHVAFEDSPEIDKIKPLLEAVMATYGFDKTDDNRLRVANMLVTLRKKSAAGVTEMELLKHIYQHGSNRLSLPEQAALSSISLEQSK